MMVLKEVTLECHSFGVDVSYLQFLPPPSLSLSLFFFSLSFSFYSFRRLSLDLLRALEAFTSDAGLVPLYLFFLHWGFRMTEYMVIRWSRTYHNRLLDSSWIKYRTDCVFSLSGFLLCE